MTSRRLQVLIPEGLQARIKEAAQHRRLTASAWVREAIERHLNEAGAAVDPLERLKTLSGPTSDINQVLAEIEERRNRH